MTRRSAAEAALSKNGKSGRRRVSDGGGQFPWGLLVSISLNQQATRVARANN